MNSTEYTEYRRSSSWRELRRRVLTRDGYRCLTCGGTQSLEVHHLTYARVGHELLDDLVTACGYCHAYVHGQEFASLGAPPEPVSPILKRVLASIEQSLRTRESA